MGHRKQKINDLREACLTEALVIIETAGVEGLSLREVSRRLGVSHQAPYKHFPSRDHLLAEVVRRAFEAFAVYLDAHPTTDNPHADLGMMGRAYLMYAREHPLQYRLMFGTPLPDATQHPEMMHSARHAFSLLRNCVGRMYGADTEAAYQQAELDALFIWSTMHGLASIIPTQVFNTLNLADAVIAEAVHHVMQRIGDALGLGESD